MIIEEAEIFQIQVVPGIDPDTQAVGYPSGFRISPNGFISVIAEIMRKRSCVKLYPIHAGLFGAFHHFGFGVYKNGDPYALFMEFLYHLPQFCLLRKGVPTVIARQLVFCVRHQRALMGWVGQNQVQKCTIGFAFYVELCSHRRA